MKNLKKIILILALALPYSCSNYQEPPITQSVSPFGMNDLENDISRDKKEIPKKLKKIIQFSADTILNVIEYDNDGNEVFKYYKQYVSEKWNGKYITMITGNIFDNGKIQKSYCFHSNTGYSSITYHYGLKKVEIEVKEDMGSDYPTAQNAFRDIETIYSLKSLLNHPIIDVLNDSDDVSYTITREYPVVGNKIEEYNNSKLTKTEQYDKNGRLVKQEYPSGNETLYYYNDFGLLSECYTIGTKMDTLKSEKRHYYIDLKLASSLVDDKLHTYTYNGNELTEITLNGTSFSDSKKTIFNALGYPITVIYQGKANRVVNYTYKMEYFKE